jgi:lathosterol oxidase
VLALLPVHEAVIFLWMIWMVLRNVMGHSGTELLPRTWIAGWWGRWFTTTLHHEMHHAYGQFNYGLYFVWWDRLCGTEHPEYRNRLARLVESLSGDQGSGQRDLADLPIAHVRDVQRAVGIEGQPGR